MRNSREENGEYDSRNPKDQKKIQKETNENLDKNLDRSQEAVTKRTLAHIEKINEEKRNVRVEELAKGTIKKICITDVNKTEKTEPEIVIAIKPDGKINIKLNPYHKFLECYYVATDLTEEEFKTYSIGFERLTLGGKVFEEIYDLFPSHKFKKTEHRKPEGETPEETRKYVQEHGTRYPENPLPQKK